jgi:hypothetical protein
MTFEEYLQSQGVEPATLTSDELKEWRRYFDEARERIAISPKVGLMKLRAVPGEQRYAVAIQDESNLWLTLWVRCSRKGEVFILYPRADSTWNAHASYHLDGTFHQKSFGVASDVTIQQRQPLTGDFKGAEHLGAYGGHGSTSIGAVCDPAAFTEVLIVDSSPLGARHGVVAVDLVEPGFEPAAVEDDQIIRRIFPRPSGPSVVITIARTALEATEH